MKEQSYRFKAPVKEKKEAEHARRSEIANYRKINKSVKKNKAQEPKKEEKKKKKKQTVRLCGVFTLRPVNEFKMASGLARSHNFKESDSQ